MAFSTILRRTASSVKPLATHVFKTHKNHFSALLSPLKNTPHDLPLRNFFPTLQFSSIAKKPSSDQSLVHVLNDEIKCTQESDDFDHVDAIPQGFPFEIEDNLGEQTILLKREYQGEVIKVEVHMPDLVTGDNGEGEDEDEDDDDEVEKSSQSSIPLTVTVSKGSGESLEFGVLAYPDEIAIDSFLVKKPDMSEDQIPYEGPDFSSLDENLQKAFHRYLEVRGIKPSTTNFLHEYMINKDSREYLMWLKNLKKFIQK